MPQNGTWKYCNYCLSQTGLPQRVVCKVHWEFKLIFLDLQCSRSIFFCHRLVMLSGYISRSDMSVQPAVQAAGAHSTAVLLLSHFGCISTEVELKPINLMVWPTQSSVFRYYKQNWIIPRPEDAE